MGAMCRCHVKIRLHGACGVAATQPAHAAAALSHARPCTFSICRRQCAFGTCCRSFHVLCGRAAGQQLTFRATDGEPLAFCELHSRPAFDKMVRAVVAARHGSGAAWLQGDGSGQAGRRQARELLGSSRGGREPGRASRSHLTRRPCCCRGRRLKSMWTASGRWSCAGWRRRRRRGRRAAAAAPRAAAAERQLGPLC